MADKTWKAVERKIASLLGGRRVPVSGRQRGDSPDIEHDWLSLEVKHRKTAVPKWQIEGMKQAQASKVEGKLPVVIIHAGHMNYDDCIVQVRLGDFIDWFI